jgi:hypothetical protein
LDVSDVQHGGGNPEEVELLDVGETNSIQCLL